MNDDDVARLYALFHTPLHVQKHCKAVAVFAMVLADKLIAKGITVDRDLLEKAALVHDLVRVVDFKKWDPLSWGYPVSNDDVMCWESLRFKHVGKNHAEVGADYLHEAGFEKIAAVVRKHNFVRIQEGFNTWEEKLLYYADKRTQHDAVVSLKERLEDGKRRNAPELLNNPESKKLDDMVYALELEIFTALGERV